MADFPFVYNMTTGRAYYGPSLQDPREQEPLWLTEEQKPYYERANPTSNLFTTLGVAGGLFAAGFIPTQKGRVWDYYVRGLRFAEEYSPAKILRTFQLSTFFSQFESAAKGTLPLAADFLRANEPYAHYLSKVIGTPEAYSRIVTEGVKLKGGRLFYGGGEEALRYAAAIRVPEKTSSYWGSGFARTIGAGEAFSGGTSRAASAYARGGRVPLAHAFFAESRPFLGDPRIMNPVLGGMPAQIIGGRNLPQYVWRQAGAWGTEFVSRFNRLLKAPFEMQPFRTVFGGLQKGLEKATGKRIEFAVKEAAGTKMLGALSLKYGLGLGAAYMGYRTLDWLVRSSETLDTTAFAEGITSGIATLGTRANVLLSRAAEITGLHTLREKQEEIAPGSTSLAKLLAFPLIGGMGAGFASYGAKVAAMAKMQIKEGVTAPQARAAVEESMRSFSDKGLVSRVRRQLTRQGGLYARKDWVGKLMRMVAKPAAQGEISYKLLGKMGPTKLAATIGAGIGAALVMPFLPGALVPSTRPEELEAIYSGEQEVPIRKGRWWEFGRSPFEGKRIMYYRPHWYPRMLMRAREKAIWGEDEEKMSPLEKWWKSEFTYELERKHYQERPYPVTALPFEDVPLIGPLLAHTVGKLIKPSQLMHTDKWLSERGAKAMPPRFGGRVATEIGETAGGVPETPHGAEGLIGEQAYRMTEMIGLPGFAMVSMKERLTGTGDLYDQMQQLESARRIAGFERFYWDLELGGLMGTCFVPGTMVKTYSGIRPIECVEIGDNVLTHGQWKTVVDKIEKIPKEDLLNIRSKSAGVDMVCTANHWIPILRRHVYDSGHVKPWNEKNYDIVEVQAKDIQLGDYLFYEIDPTESPYSIDLVNTGKATTDKYVYKQASRDFAIGYELMEAYFSQLYPHQFGRKELRDYGIPDLVAKEIVHQFWSGKKPKRVPRYIEVTPDVAYFIGWYIAEGCSDGTKLTFTMHADELVYAEKLSRIASEIGFNSKISIKNNTLRLKVYSSQLARYFDFFGLGARKKWIPEQFKRLPKQTLSKLIEGLMLGDGWTGGFTSTSKQLVRDLFDCLLKLEKPAYLTLDYLERSSGEYPQGGRRKDCLRHYLDLRSKKLLWKFIDNAYLVPVSSVDVSDQRHDIVYDLTIEDLHHYTAEGIRVHNTEAFRRLYPHRRRQIPLYNPIRNLMPEWLPGPGEKSPDFLHGDPYTKVPEGELRLPGVGYAQRFPELEGLSPDEYPLIHKYKILADVAPWSDKFKQHRQMIRSARKRDTWTDEMERIYQTTEEQLKKKKTRTEFQEYEYLSPMGEIVGDRRRWGGEEGSGLVSALNQFAARQDESEKPGLIKKLFGGYWEMLAHNAETAADVLTPISPAAKLVHTRTAIESYERTQVYGTENAFWQHPMRDFIKPFTNLLGHSFGFSGVPTHIESKRALEEYFDMIEYVKNARLSNLARAAGDADAVKEFEARKDQTMFGINPFTRNYTSIFRALPRRDRDYFNSFAEAETPEQRARILEMVPENEKALYIARWKLAFADEIKKAKKAGVLSEKQLEEADEVLDRVYAEAAVEGFPTSQELYAEYISTRMPGESYGDWYRRTQLLSKAPALPGPDWVGWHPSVDLEDIKLAVVQTLGEDMHDYDLWQDRARGLVNKPYINDAAIAEIMSPDELTGDQIRGRINEVLGADKVRGDVFVRHAFSQANEASVTIDIEEEPDEGRRGRF